MPELLPCWQSDSWQRNSRLQSVWEDPSALLLLPFERALPLWLPVSLLQASLVFNFPPPCHLELSDTARHTNFPLSFDDSAAAAAIRLEEQTLSYATANEPERSSRRPSSADDDSTDRESGDNAATS